MKARVTICHVYTANLKLRCTFGTISTARTMLRSEPPSLHRKNLAQPQNSATTNHLDSTSNILFPTANSRTNRSKRLPKTPGPNRSIFSTNSQTLKLPVLGFRAVASIITVIPRSYEIIRRSIWSLYCSLVSSGVEI